MNERNIYLVGFMATGKTAVGRELAKRLSREFIDLDDVVEQREKMRIVEIFEQKGEAHFRKLEKDLILEISQIPKLIVGCGGGAVTNPDNLATLKKSGVLFCLKADADTILKRAKGTDQRPLLNVESPRQRIIDLLKKREQFYSQADHSIDTSSLSVAEVADQIISIFKKI